MITKFLGPERQVFRHRAKKNTEFLGKTFMRVEKADPFLPKRPLKKTEFFCGRKSVSTIFTDLSKIFSFSMGTFSQQFCRKTMPNFRRKLWSIFSCKEFFFSFLCSIKLFWDLRRNIFALNLKLHSRCSEKIIDVFSFEKKIISSFFFRLWAKEFQFL